MNSTGLRGRHRGQRCQVCICCFEALAASLGILAVDKYDTLVVVVGDHGGKISILKGGRCETQLALLPIKYLMELIASRAERFKATDGDSCCYCYC